MVQKALARGVAVSGLREEILALDVSILPFDPDDAERTATLWPQTSSLGLSLGDRACLALGICLALAVYTADRSWKRLDIGVTVETIRE